ncbi:MAG: VanZ family protein [Singulisphaera sp.]
MMGLRPREWLLAALVFGGMFVPMPGGWREIGALSDLAHAPIFGFLTLIILRGLRSRRPGSSLRSSLVAWAMAVALGVAIEILQGLTGRSASWHDVLADASGGGAFLIWASTPRAASRGVRIGLYSAAVILIAVPSTPPLLLLTDVAMQVRDGPRLASFEGPLELSRWEFQDSRHSRSTSHATEGRWSLRLDMGRGDFPGATLEWPVRDWTGYHDLQFDTYLEPGSGLDLVVKIEDAYYDGRYGDRYLRTVPLTPGPNRTRIALSEVERVPDGRRLDLGRIRRLQFFTVGPSGPRTLFFDGIRLR